MQALTVSRYALLAPKDDEGWHPIEELMDAISVIVACGLYGSLGDSCLMLYQIICRQNTVCSWEIQVTALILV